MNENCIPSDHPLSKDQGGPEEGSTVPGRKTGQAPTVHGVNSRGWQEEGEGKVKCPGVKRFVQEEQGSLWAFPLPSKDPGWAKVYKFIITLHL